MSQRHFSNWLDAYLEYTQFSEAPDQFHFWTGISTIAGALRRHVWIDMGYFTWTPNFYIVFVAPPGIVSKSTTANIGMNLLRAAPGIHFGPDAVTWQSLIQSLGHSTEAFDHEGLLHTMSAITIVSSEFGTFLNPQDREMVDVLVSLWDGQIGVWQKATKTQGNDSIANPWINMIACTTPAWISGNFPEYMIGGGFTSRTIFIYAEDKRKLVAYPSEHLPPEYEEKKLQLIHDLELISAQVVGPYIISPEAKKWGEQWYEDLFEKNKGSLVFDRFAGYVARKQTHMHKLAMVLAAARSDSRVITPALLASADLHLNQAEIHMEKVFQRITAPEAKHANALKEYFTRNYRVERIDLQRAMFQVMSFEQLTEALNSCVASEYIRRDAVANKVFFQSLIYEDRSKTNGAAYHEG